MSLVLRITDAGRAALVNAARDGTNAVRIASVGVSPTAIVAAANTAALPGEVKRIATISGAGVAADVIHLVVRDETNETYTVRSLALYLTDGTLFAAYGQAAPIIEKSAGALLLLAIDATLLDVAANQITFGNTNFLNPPATTETAGVLELATDAEAAALTDALRALTPKSMAAIFTAANILSRLLNVDGAGSGLDADLLDGRQGSEFALLTGGTFTGGITFGAGTTFNAGMFRDNYFYLNLPSATTADLSFDAGDVLRYDRTANTYAFLIGSMPAMTIGAAGIKRAGNVVWDAANDGAGSGLDADLLDGQHGAWYADIAGRLGFTPLDSSTYTPANILSKIVTVDGTGSGLDADLLDGRQAAEFALLTGGTFTGGITFGAGTTFNAGIFRDSYFYLNLTNATTADVSFDAGDVLRYDRTANAYSFLIGSTPAMTINTSGITRAGNTVWDAANDGAGSGLDADLLDGRQAAEFALLTGGTFTGGITFGAGTTFNAGIFRDSYFYLNLNNATTADLSFDAGDVLRYDRTANTYSFLIGSTPAMAVGTAGITRAGNTVWDAANDGSGSGLDADMLDGHNGADFALLAGGTFTGTVTFAGGLYRDANFYMNLPNATVADVSFDAGDVLRYDRSANTFSFLIGSAPAMTIGAAGITRAGSTMWDAANDGSGSGLDADLLDGRHAADFVLQSAFGSASLAANGYQVLPGGLILQWVTGAQNATGSEPSQFVGFPITFPNACLKAFPTTRIDNASNRADVFYQLVGAPSANGVVVQRQYTAQGTDDRPTTPDIWAIGY